ncbi:ABC transporter ATP-binding protein [Desulforudis sp. 1088]|uniref:ABC transporter ATP-binding protein n=1 Tax=unclassified Candidatus Desulforudis TaxID=2635950 RepID=UPI003CE5707E
MERLIEINNLKKHFRVGRNQTLKAVDGISLTIYKGETLGLVGESGCGKSTVGRLIVRLYNPTEGQILYRKQDIFHAGKEQSRRLYRRLQMIFQDPYASLNPRLTVGEIIGEALDIHRLAKGSERRDKINKLIKMVGLDPSHASRFPHEFSGGQRQRVGIARALAVDPEFVVCDEPISALDVSIQAQIVNLLQELQERLGLTYLFIAHDLAMVKHISTRIAVMYLGCIVELADSEELYRNPVHPYTRALLSAIPIADPEIESNRQRIILSGDVPSPINTPPGCIFAGRCPQARDRCHEERPELRDVGGGHQVACLLV